MFVTAFVGLGSNLTGADGTLPRETCERAVGAIVAATGGSLVGVSRWYRSAPVPQSDQPNFINGVVAVRGAIAPLAWLQKLQAIESQAGRVRSARNAARVLDLDVLAIDDLVLDTDALTLPHPRMAERAFVMVPFCDVAPFWRHPVLGLSARELRDRITGQRVSLDADDTQSLPLAGRAPR